MQNAVRHKRETGSSVLQCPVRGCTAKLIEYPEECALWSKMVEVCGRGHLVDLNCYLQLKQAKVTRCPVCRDPFLYNPIHTIPTVALLSDGTQPQFRALDALWDELDAILAEHNSVNAYVMHRGFNEMIQDIFFAPLHGILDSDTGHPRIFLLANDMEQFSQVEIRVNNFRICWKHITDVLNLQQPCIKSTLDRICTCLDDLICYVDFDIRPDTTFGCSIFKQIELTMHCFEQAREFIEENT